MFDLDKAVGDWRGRLRSRHGVLDTDILELESHLRDSVDALSPLPLSEQERFLVASFRLGDTDTLAREFAKNRWNERHVGFLPVEYIRPDGQVDGQVYAGFSRRFQAGVFDACVIVLLYLTFVPALYLSPSWAVALVILRQLLVATYAVVMPYCFGGSAGKLMAGIRITQPDGSPLSLTQAFRRSAPFLVFSLLELGLLIQCMDGVVLTPEPTAWELFYPLHQSQHRDAMLLLNRLHVWWFIWLGISFLMLLRDPFSRSPHDHLADTIVIDEEFAEIARRPDSFDPNDLRKV